jgi:hypothetical protein
MEAEATIDLEAGELDDAAIEAIAELLVALAIPDNP